MTDVSPADRVCYVNGAFVPYGQATLPLNDLAILRGYGVFDALRTYGGAPFKLDEHLRRLGESARAVGIPMPWSTAELREIVLETLRRNPPGEATVRIQVTGGPSLDSITPLGRPVLVVIIAPLRAASAEAHANGVKVITFPLERPMPRAKTIDYVSALQALAAARARGAVEALYTDRYGAVSEGTTSNFFIFLEGALVTAADGVLEGITRQVVLDLAARHFTVIQRPISPNDLTNAQEAFLTSTSKEVLPVVQVDDHVIHDGRPGPSTQRLFRLFQEYARSFE